MRKIGTGTYKMTVREKEYLSQAINTGRLSYGPLCQRFERQFANLHGCKHGVLSNSGTSSLLVALQTLKELHGWQAGDEVIVPAITFVATVNVVLHLGLKPVLVDVEPDYYGIDVNKIEGAITDKTRCIIPVHTFGQPCDLTGVYSIGRGYDLEVIQDSCECMFVKYRGAKIGWSPDGIACFSTYMAHLITTGVGGIATTNNPDYARTMRSLVNHGMAYDDLSEGDSFSPQRVGRDFVFDRIGHSFRITELEAALGLAQLETWPDMIATRQAHAVYLCHRLKELDYRLQLPKVRPNAEHAFMMYPVVCKQEGVRDRLCRHLNERGIETRRMLPLVSQPCYRGLWEPEDYPVARWIDDNGYYVGCHQHLSKADLDYMVEVHRDFFNDPHG